MTALSARDLAFSYETAPVLTDVSVDLREGELVGLIGANGSGKTTLMHLLFGLLEPSSGTVTLGGEDLTGLSRMEIARRAALVPQGSRTDFAFTVRELVAMGRTPYLGRFRPEGEADAAAIDRALEATETTALSDRLISELSGGELQRVNVARALAQETPVLFLDEPIASLDVEHQLQILELVKSLVDGGKSAVIALHDLTLAARYCDRLVVLADHRVAAVGTPEEVITEENLARYFRVQARVQRDAATNSLLVVPISTKDG